MLYCVMLGLHGAAGRAEAGAGVGALGAELLLDAEQLVVLSQPPRGIQIAIFNLNIEINTCLSTRITRHPIVGHLLCQRFIPQPC